MGHFWVPLWCLTHFGRDVLFWNLPQPRLRIARTPGPTKKAKKVQKGKPGSPPEKAASPKKEPVQKKIAKGKKKKGAEKPKAGKKGKKKGEKGSKKKQKKQKGK